MFEIKNHRLGASIRKYNRRKNIDSIILHHTYAGNIEKAIKTLISKDCGTHYIIDRDGAIYQLVSPFYRVNHCCTMNDNSIGIDLQRAPNEEILENQYESLNNLLKYLCENYNINPVLHDGIFFHRDIRQTNCPGNILEEKIYGYTSN